MIVPRSRLLLWVAAVVVPFATVAGLFPATAPLALVVIGIFVVVIILDAVLAYGTLDGISIETPGVTRLSKDRSADLELRIKNLGKKEKALRVGLELQVEVHSPQDDLTTLLPANAELSRITWPCTPLKRGNFPLSLCYLEGSSPLGLWSMRGKTALKGELRVYPNLNTERKSVAALFLNRGAFGIHAQRQIGKGRDFEKLREYVPGDSYDDIHWKATGKRGKPVTKVFQIERTQEVYVIIDSSRLSAREVSNPKSPGLNLDEPSRVSILERYITAALVLGLAAEQQGDLFGLVTFSDKIQNFVRARNGKAHYASCRDALYTLHPRAVSPDFDELASFIRLRLRRRALLVILTALDDPVLAETFTRNMDLICRQHLVVVNMMKPPGAEPVFSNPNVSSLDEVYQQLGGHILWHNLRELDKTLQRRGVRFSMLENEKLSTQLITQYLSVKQRQLL